MILRKSISQVVIHIKKSKKDKKIIMSKPIAKITITPNCCRLHGIEGAFDEACKLLKKSYNLFAGSDFNKDKIWCIELHIKK